MSADRCESALVSATDLKAADHAVADLDVIAAPDDAGIDRSQENDCRRNRTGCPIRHSEDADTRDEPKPAAQRGERAKQHLGGVKFQV